MRNPIEFFAEREVFNRRISIRAGARNSDHSVSAARPVIFEKRDEVEFIDPMLSLTWEEAQRLVDELWLVGIRPSEGAGSAGAMAAVQAHLQDMRALVFEMEPKK